MPPMMIRKKYGHTLSILKGSNKATACSKADWLPIKEGSFLALNGDSNFYKIVSKNKIFYTRESVVLNSDQLKVEGHTGVNLSINDNISFMNKEYEVESTSILTGGTGYKAGDVLKPSDGLCKYNSVDGLDVHAEFVVSSVNENGAVTSLLVKTRGLYNIPPTLHNNAVGSLGEGLKLALGVKPIENRSVEERSISNIEYKEDHTVLYLNHPLPPRIREGTISVNKWEVQLSSEYVGENKFNIDYEIIKDFTPNLDLPLIRGDISSSYLLYNESMILLDKKIKELEEKINSLGS